jgi:hypothetical protein
MTVQYGVGPSFAAQCPPTPAPPTGYRVWTPHDGPVPASVIEVAKRLAYDMSKPLGTSESVPIPGMTVIVRLDPHTWTTGPGGQHLAGCFHGATVYLPDHHILPPSTPSRGARVVEGLSLLSIIGGLALTGREFLR